MSLLDDHWERVSPRQGRERIRCFCSQRSFFKTHIPNHVRTARHRSYMAAWRRSVRTESVTPDIIIMLDTKVSSVLEHIIKMNNGPLLRKFIDVSGIDVNAVFPTGYPLIVFASRVNAVESVRELIDMGADINRTGRVSAIFCAVENNNIEMIQTLLEHGADSTIAPKDGMNALTLAQLISPTYIFTILKRSRLISKQEEARDCDICYESRTSFWKCPRCVHSHCNGCHVKLIASTCPGCRLEFE